MFSVKPVQTATTAKKTYQTMTTQQNGLKAIEGPPGANLKNRAPILALKIFCNERTVGIFL